jgi:hypothetical protein
MPDDPSGGQDDYPTPSELRSWAQRETANVGKASELRLRDLNEFVSAYEKGEITPDQAEDRQARYLHRWDEALPGIDSTEKMTDEQILASIDATRGPYLSTSTIRERYRKQFGSDTQRRTR